MGQGARAWELPVGCLWLVKQRGIDVSHLQTLATTQRSKGDMRVSLQSGHLLSQLLGSPGRQGRRYNTATPTSHTTQVSRARDRLVV